MIITEKEKSHVVFSSLFLRHYPKLYEQLHDIMWSYHKGNGVVCHTKDYWVRDFMPVQVDEDVFVKFIFNPDYLQDRKKYITDVDKVIKNCPFAQEYKIVNIPIILDGGNLVFCIGYDCLDETAFVVMTEKVLSENPKLCKEQIEMLFKYAFQEPYLIVVWLPWDKEDTFGHTDGIVRYVGYNALGRPKVLVNLELYDEEIAEQMYDALNQYFEVIELKLSEYHELSWAYINSLQTQDFIIIPGIGNAITDAEALEQYKQLFPEYEGNIYQVQMREFIEEHGGALNCLTWTIQENNLKMLCKGAHIPIVGFEDNKDYPPYQEEIDNLLRKTKLLEIEKQNTAMEKLMKRLIEVNKSLNESELDALFPDLAKFLMGNYCIESKSNKYFINEIEFYFYGDNYDDLRTNKKSTVTYSRNSKAGCWYIHDYGVDLTFESNEKQKYGGGILIRTVEDNDGNVFDGPVKCVNEMWEEAVSAFKATAPNPVIIPEEREIELDEPTLRKAVGKDDSHNKLWRFTVKGKKVSK